MKSTTWSTTDGAEGPLVVLFLGVIIGDLVTRCLADFQARIGDLRTAMWSSSVDPQASEELRARLKYFLFGRVTVISGFLVMVAIAYLRTARERFDVPVDDLLRIVAATYAFSALSAMLLPHLRRPAAFAYVQLAFDVLLVSGVILLTGGVDSPFAFLTTPANHQRRRAAVRGGALFAAVCSALAYDPSSLRIGR
jgi:hypothetical protein